MSYDVTVNDCIANACAHLSEGLVMKQIAPGHEADLLIEHKSMGSNGVNSVRGHAIAIT